MRRCFFISLLLASAFPSRGFSQGNSLEDLDKGMELHSDSLMHKFFEAWFDSSEAIRRQPVSDLQKEAEEVVEIMWNPANYHTLLWGWTADSITSRQLPAYIVVWPVIKIYPNVATKIPVDSLENMFPGVLYGSKTLSYNAPFINAMRKILNWRNQTHVADQKFLSKFVTISCHMGGCGVLGEPNISLIKFRDNGNTAIVNFGMAEQGVEETLSKVNGIWKPIGRKMIWIE